MIDRDSSTKKLDRNIVVIVAVVVVVAVVAESCYLHY